MEIIRQNMDVTKLDDCVTITKKATNKDWRELEDEARKRFKVERSGIDKNNHLFFVVNKGFTRYRFTLVN